MRFGSKKEWHYPANINIFSRLSKLVTIGEMFFIRLYLDCKPFLFLPVHN